MTNTLLARGSATIVPTQWSKHLLLLFIKCRWHQQKILYMRPHNPRIHKTLEPESDTSMAPLPNLCAPQFVQIVQLKVCRWVGLPQPHPAASLLAFSSLGKPSPTHPCMSKACSVHLEEQIPCFLVHKLLAALSCLQPTSPHFKPTHLSPPSPQNLSPHNPPFAFAKACTKGNIKEWISKKKKHILDFVLLEIAIGRHGATVLSPAELESRHDTGPTPLFCPYINPS